MLGGLKGWFTALSTLAKVGVISGASLLLLGTAGAIEGPKTPTPTPTPPPKTQTTEHKTVTTTEAVPFDTKTVDDATLAAGTDKTTTEGVNGVKTKTYDVTYTNGTETSRTLTKEEVTTQSVTKVIAHGTYVAPAAVNCPNGTYVNSAGNTVCSPSTTPATGISPTAICRDGSYSYSQSRSGTCSHHGGVETWL